MITNPKSNPSLMKILKILKNIPTKNGQFLQKRTKILFGHAQIRKYYVTGHSFGDETRIILWTLQKNYIFGIKSVFFSENWTKLDTKTVNKDHV